MRYLVAGLIACVLLPVSAVADDETYNVDFRVGWGGCYRPMRWTAVQVNVTPETLKEPYQGVVQLSALQDDLNTLVVRHPVVMSPDTVVILPLATKFAFGASDCDVSILDEKGRRRFFREWGLWDAPGGARSIVPVARNELLIGVVGEPGFGLGRLPRGSRCVHDRAGGGRVYVRRKFVRQMPWDWTGYDGLDALVLYDPGWLGMKAQQARAVAEWVRRGGRLLLVLGSNALPAQHPVASLLPYDVGKRRRTELGSASLRSLGLSDGRASDAEISLWALEGDGAFGWQAGQRQAGLPVTASGPAGFGRVTVLPFDPAELGRDGPMGAEAQAGLWVAQLSKLLVGERRIEESGQGSRGGTDPGSYYHYDMGVSAESANAVLEHLLRIPELRPLSIWVVILLLLGLALLLGPVDYFVLKRLDRLPLTWITSGVTIAVFSVGAYYGVEALRAGRMQVRAVSVVDAVQGGDAWRTVYAGIFAPHSDDYALEGLSEREWWSAAAPTRSRHLSRYGAGVGTRHVYCVQADGANRPVSLPINIWSMQCLVCESPAGEIPLDATVRRHGDDVEVRVVNRADVPIRTGRVRVAGPRWAPLGEVPPSGERTFRVALRRGGQWDTPDGVSPHAYGGSVSYAGRFDREQSYFTPPTRPRTEALERLLRDGAAVVCVEYVRNDIWFSVAGRDATCDHIQVVRLAVLPEGGSR